MIPTHRILGRGRILPPRLRCAEGKFRHDESPPPINLRQASASGVLEKFDDLPPSLRGNADVIDLPLTRHQGHRPVWSDADIDDVAAFLRTLTDSDAALPGMN